MKSFIYSRKRMSRGKGYGECSLTQRCFDIEKTRQFFYLKRNGKERYFLMFHSPFKPDSQGFLFQNRPLRRIKTYKVSNLDMNSTYLTMPSLSIGTFLRNASNSSSVIFKSNLPSTAARNCC